MYKSYAIPGLFSAKDTALKSKKIVAAKKVDAFWYFASLSVVFVIVGLFVNYLFGVNNYASSGYEIKKLQSQVARFSEENKKISLKVSELSLMLNIQNELQAAGFVSAGTPTFLSGNQFTRK
jgi:hypothetical protein